MKKNTMKCIGFFLVLICFFIQPVSAQPEMQRAISNSGFALGDANAIEGHMDVTNTITGDTKLLTANLQFMVNQGNPGQIQAMNQITLANLIKESGLDAGESIGQEERIISDEPVSDASRFKIRIKADCGVEDVNVTRVLRIPIEGTVPDLAQTQDKYKLRVTFLRDGLPLEDRDSLYCTRQGLVANYFPLKSRHVRKKSNDFSMNFYVPLNDFDITGIDDTNFTIQADIIENERVLAEAAPYDLTIEKQWMPRVRYSKMKVDWLKTAPDSDGFDIIGKAKVGVTYVDDEHLRFEMVVMTSDDKDIPVSDARYRMLDNKAGVVWMVDRSVFYHTYMVDHTLPGNVLHLPVGENTLNVYFRAVYSDGQVIGSSRPTEITVVK